MRSGMRRMQRAPRESSHGRMEQTSRTRLSDLTKTEAPESLAAYACVRRTPCIRPMRPLRNLAAVTTKTAGPCEQVQAAAHGRLVQTDHCSTTSIYVQGLSRISAIGAGGARVAKPLQYVSHVHRLPGLGARDVRLPRCTAHLLVKRGLNAGVATAEKSASS